MALFKLFGVWVEPHELCLVPASPPAVTVTCEFSIERCSGSGPGLKERFPLPMNDFMHWKVRDSLPNLLFTHCSPPEAWHTSPPRESTQGHPAAGAAADGRAAPGRARPGCHRGIRAARTFCGGCCPFRRLFPIGADQVCCQFTRLRCPIGAPASSPSRTTSTCPASLTPHCGCLFLRAPQPGPGRAGRPRLAQQARHGRPART